MRLLDRPASLPVLRAQLVREMHYWLLAGRHGPAIRRLGWPDSHAQRVARAVAVLRNEFSRPVLVERLADVAGMSPSSFHQHFRNVTSLTPLQFQKQLRLIEARRLMLWEGASASSAAFAVGYESVPQFTREYGRMFGLPAGARHRGRERHARSRDRERHDFLVRTRQTESDDLLQRGLHRRRKQRERIDGHGAGMPRRSFDCGDANGTCSDRSAGLAVDGNGIDLRSGLGVEEPGDVAPAAMLASPRADRK
jgi:AraC-like DNA-binding protein